MAGSGSVISLDVPSSLAEKFERGVIGEARGAPFVDVPGSTGFERIVSGDLLDAVNQGIANGTMRISRFRIAF